jgi:hypothetical protein
MTASNHNKTNASIVINDYVKYIKIVLGPTWVILLACQNATIRKTPFLNFMFYQPFSSDLDRGFSIINYDINEVSKKI